MRLISSATVEAIRITQIVWGFGKRQRSAGAAAWQSPHLDDYFAFRWCVLEFIDLHSRTRPYQAAIAAETHNPVIVRRVHTLHRMLENVDAVFRAFDRAHALRDCMCDAASSSARDDVAAG